MTDQTNGHDDALDIALRGLPRPTVDPQLRDAHIAVALDALADAAGAPSHDSGNVDQGNVKSGNVMVLATRRRRLLGTLGAVAAAGLFAVGLGIGRASAPDAPVSSVPVRNAAPSSPGSLDGCPQLGLGDATRVVTQFGTYVLVRREAQNAAELLVVDTTACSIVTRIDLSDSGG